MNLNNLKDNIKQIVLNEGAKLVGIGSEDRLKDAPPSGNMDYCLSGAQSCIIWAYPNPIEALENYFSKKERMSIKKAQQIGYAGAWRTALVISEFIEKIRIIRRFQLFQMQNIGQGKIFLITLREIYDILTFH